MPTLIYIHGFRSSPLSSKAQLTQRWLAQNRPDWQFECPYVPSEPRFAKPVMDALLAKHQGDEIYLLGSSLGGFWASYVSERCAAPTVLINPAVSPQERFQGLIGTPLKNYYNDTVCVLDTEDIGVMVQCDFGQLRHPHLYWLIVQTGDEVLDYRHATAKYQGCRQTVETGGDHGFQGFESWLPEITDFFEASRQSPA